MMADQAQRLRELFERPVATVATDRVVPFPVEKRYVRSIAVTSGKGGVGKTNIVANLAMALSRRGKKVLVVDADLSLANVDVLLGMNPAYNLSHVLAGTKRLGEVLVEGPAGIRILPAASGSAELSNLREDELDGLTRQFASFMPDLDLVLIDTGAGLSDSVLAFVHSAAEVLIVTTPEPTAYIDAYQMLKNVHNHDPQKPVHLVINMAASEKEAQQTVDFMKKMSERFLHHTIRSFGWVLRDPDVPLAIRAQKAFLDESPHGIAARGIHGLATRLLNSGPDAGSRNEENSLWKRVAGFLKKRGT